MTRSSKVSGSVESSSGIDEATVTVHVAVGLVDEGGADSVARRAEPDLPSASSPRKDGPLSSCHAPQQ